MDTVVRASNLSKEVATAEGKFQIFSEISLELKQAGSLSIVGRSGSGKSTLLGLLAGLDMPTAGKVELLGSDLATLDEDGRARLRATGVGFVFQSFHLLPTLSAIENILMPMELLSIADAQRKARTALDEVGLADRQQHYPAQLSGGEQQRVAIARAFVLQPRVLFVDEPTGNLDYATGQKISQLLFELRQQHGTAIVLATHDLELSKQCDNTLTLH